MRFKMDWVDYMGLMGIAIIVTFIVVETVRLGAAQRQMRAECLPTPLYILDGVAREQVFLCEGESING